MYNNRVQRLLKDLPNRGSCPNPTHCGRAENPVCGDVTEIEFRISEERIVDCRFRVYGCPGAVAAAAGLTELVRGESFETCRMLGTEELLEFLGGLPKQKEHGADLAIAAFRNALAGPV